jgi:beta-1,4-mannosyltransferase
MITARRTCARDRPSARIEVLQSFGELDPEGGNPYLHQLVSSLPPLIRCSFFRWRTALFGCYDVFHLHWPEHLLVAQGSKGLVKSALFGLLLIRLAISRVPVIRTVHNPQPHEGVGLLDRWLLSRADRLTSYSIVMSRSSVAPPSNRRLIPHGHYRDWYGPSEAQQRVPGRLLFFGLIREYKGIPELIAAFGETADPSSTLSIVGLPFDAGLAARVVERAAADPRVSVTLGHASDAALALAIREAELVALPYAHMLNSGALLLALSLDRPVLVPRTPGNEELSNEVGSGWILMYDGPLTAEALGAALQAAGAARGGRPDLSRREWPELGQQLAEVYREAVRSGRRDRDDA